MWDQDLRSACFPLVNFFLDRKATKTSVEEKSVLFPLDLLLHCVTGSSFTPCVPLARSGWLSERAKMADIAHFTPSPTQG